MPAKLVGVHRTFQYYRCKSLQAHYNDYNAPQYLPPHNKNQTSHSVLESLTVQELMRLQMSQVTHKLPMFEFIQHAHLKNHAIHSNGICPTDKQAIRPKLWYLSSASQAQALLILTKQSSKHPYTALLSSACLQPYFFIMNSSIIYHTHTHICLYICIPHPNSIIA